MSETPFHVSVDEMYSTPDYDEDEFASDLDRSLAPRPSTMLLERFDALGTGPEDLVLDIGCRDAHYACGIAERCGSRVLAVDPVADHVREGRGRVRERGLGGRVEVVRGRIEEIPAENGSIAAIFCRDMLSHVPHLEAGFRECARVLRPGGAMLVYVTLATALIEPGEAERIYAALAVVPENTDPTRLEGAAAAAGLAPRERDEVGSEWREAWEEDGTRLTSGQLLRIARMRRNRDALVSKYGRVAFEVELANCTWGVYQMLGKLVPTVYVFAKAG